MISGRQEVIREIQLLNEALRRQAKNEFNRFVLYMKDGYDMQWFHSYICSKLELFEQGKIRKMMILMPPQHGKSELSTRLFPPYLLGKNPDRKIAVTSYGDQIASGFNRDIQRYIDSEKYHAVFPQTLLPGSQLFNTPYGKYSRTEHKFDIVGFRGTLKTVGRGGGLTSETVDIGVIDDLYKDREEARSPTISEHAWNWYVDVFRTRFHNNSQQLIMNTRWDENDLAGRLLMEEPGEWEVIKFPAIKERERNHYDPRSEGEVLWESRHSMEKILGHKHLSEVSFNSLYQQDPKPNTEILIFKNWIQIPEWPDNFNSITWGLDFGKTTGTNALIKCATTAEGYFFDECLYERGSSEDRIAKCLVANGYKEGEIVHCDHEMTKINALRMHEHRINASKAIKGPGSVSFGIGKLNEMPCHYTARSLNIKMELNNYQYISFGKVITNEPADGFDHAMDACRYGSVGRFFTGR